MGYSISIEKRNGELIVESEWDQFVSSDSSLILANEVTSNSPSGDVIKVGGKMTYWTGHPSNSKPIFLFSRGRLSITNPDAITLIKMKEVASTFGAVVVGEEGEIY